MPTYTPLPRTEWRYALGEYVITTANDSAGRTDPGYSLSGFAAPHPSGAITMRTPITWRDAALTT